MGKLLKSSVRNSVKPEKKSSSVSEKKGFIKSLKEKFSFLRWLDPFTYVDLFVMPRVKKITKSEFVENIVNVFFAALFAFLFYTILGILFGSSTPLVIVYSASMEPELYRGDVIGLSSANEKMNFGPEVVLNQNINNVPTYLFAEPVYSSSGDLLKIVFSNGQDIFPEKSSRIIVYSSFPAGIPIIHRTIAHIKASDGEFVLTKGDNVVTNSTFDADCGKIINGRTEKSCITLFAIPVKQIQGVAFFNIPKVGCAKLWLVDDLLSLVSTGKLPSDFRGIC